MTDENHRDRCVWQQGENGSLLLVLKGPRRHKLISHPNHSVMSPVFKKYCLKWSILSRRASIHARWNMSLTSPEFRPWWRSVPEGGTVSVPLLFKYWPPEQQSVCLSVVRPRFGPQWVWADMWLDWERLVRPILRPYASHLSGSIKALK